MARMKSYRLDRVLVEQGEAYPAQWTFAGASMSGTEQWYGVTDGNFPGRNSWEFVLRIPKAAGERIEVRGCDLFEFRDGLIVRKDSFWKIVE